MGVGCEFSKLSLLAQLDDLMRFVESLLVEDLFDDKMKILLANCEKQRIAHLLDRNELVAAKENIYILQNKTKCLETTLKNVREAFKKELSLREKIQAERDIFYKTLNKVKEFLREDIKLNKTDAKEKVLSCLNLQKLQPVVEENSSYEKSFSDIEFDKTDEDIFNEQDSIKNKSNKNSKPDLDDLNIEEKVSSISEKSKLAESPLNAFVNAEILDQDVDLNHELDNLNNKNTPSTKSTASVTSRFSTLSQSIIKKRASIISNELRIENRVHSFVSKKIFKPEKCSPCGNLIGFCSTCYHCRDCRAICHIGCKDKVPLPCIPYVSRAKIGKHGRLELISDYVLPNCKPRVPAIIIHCCTEIEKRCMNEIGLYRIPAYQKEVNHLKEKILKSKNGVPSLEKVDIYVLCDVVKSFLRQLDEPLICREFWRDFVTAVNNAKYKNEEKRNHFFEIILDLPNANRDTLAYIILHLRKIASYPEIKMPISNLVKVFASTIVGFSMRDPPSPQIYEEHKKQIEVMDYFLNLDEEFWKSILEVENDVLLNNSFAINLQDISICEKTILDKKRLSIGTKMYGGGGRISIGPLTPLKEKVKKKRDSGPKKNIATLF